MIEISAKLINRIKLHGEEVYNEECCGALFGKSSAENRTVFDVLEFVNEKLDGRQNRFLINPDQYKSAEKLAREKNLELLGFYHSHPDHPAQPSQFDIDHALPWFVYIIISVNNAKANKVTSWILKEDRSEFDNQKIKVRDGEKSPILKSEIVF